MIIEVYQHHKVRGNSINLITRSEVELSISRGKSRSQNRNSNIRVQASGLKAKSLYLLIWDFLLSQINMWTTTTWSNVWVVLPKPSWYEHPLQSIYILQHSPISVWFYPCSYICNCLKMLKNSQINEYSDPTGKFQTNPSLVWYLGEIECASLPGTLMIEALHSS